MSASEDAARHVLNSPAIQSSRVAAYVGEEDGRLSVRWHEIRETLGDTLSDGQIVLVNAAHALWSGRLQPLIRPFEPVTGPALTALNWLDPDHFRIVLEALAIKRGMTVHVTETV